MPTLGSGEVVLAKGKVMVSSPPGADSQPQRCSLGEGDVEGQRAGLASAGVKPRSEAGTSRARSKHGLVQAPPKHAAGGTSGPQGQQCKSGV